MVLLTVRTFPGTARWDIRAKLEMCPRSPFTNDSVLIYLMNYSCSHHSLVSFDRYPGFFARMLRLQ